MGIPMIGLPGDHSAVRAAPVPGKAVAKTYGGSVPEAMARAEIASGMTPASPFGPGAPLAPYDGYERVPRSHQFVPGYNISARPRLHERVAFSTLQGLVEAYDIAQIAIWHRIDTIRALDWRLVAMDGYNGDVTDAIALGKKALKKPDHIHSFSTWFAKWMYDVLAYDAGSLYRMRNRGGQCIGLSVVDGTTIAPLQDYWGNPPRPLSPGDPAPEAYAQYINGLAWNWLTYDDLIYEPFRPVPNSLYGKAPLETILLNANTDIRFQLYFLEKFTAGNIPAAFASAPETWSPEQIEDFQEYWDGYMLGEQDRKHQVRWMPGGSKFAWSNEKDFQDHFSLFLMRKSLAAYHVVPADVGFTENVNKSSGESQADVSHKVGEAPLEDYSEGIIDSWLQDDLGLPIAFKWDRGEEQDDRKDQAEADKVYVDMGAIGASEIRQMRYGLAEPGGRPVPRFINSSRSGPIPLAALFAVAGEIDPETGAPVPGAQLPRQVFGGVEGVMPNPPIKMPSLAEQEFGPSAMPAAPPPQPPYQEPQQLAPPAAPPVAKDAAPAAGGAGAPAGGQPTAGITADTGIYGYDLAGRDHEEDDEDEEGARERVAKAGLAELATFRRFTKARVKAGVWQDFEFRAAGPDGRRVISQVAAHRLNDAGRLAVRKAAGEIAVAGLAVLAADTGRVLMLQRALCEDDPAAGMWEFPGGHLEGDESPLAAAWREWSEETSLTPPPGVQTGAWTSPDGIYQGIVWTVESEASVPVRGTGPVTNPDDPDGDQVEAVAWWDPAQLEQNPAVRAELAANLPEVLAALGCSPPAVCCGGECCQGGCCGGSSGCSCGQPAAGDQSVCPCGIPVVYDESNGWQHADGSISHDDGESVSDKMAAPVAKGGIPGRTRRSGFISLDLPEGVIIPATGGVTDHHITVVYLGRDVDDAAFAAVCDRARAAAAAMAGPLTGAVGGLGTFPASGSSDGLVPAWAPVALPGARLLREALEDLSASEHADWRPHVTLAYVEPGAPLPAPVPETPITFTHLSVHRGDDVVTIPLGPSGGVVAKAADEPVMCPCGVPMAVHLLNDNSEPGSDETGQVAKAADAHPKAGDWPGWEHDLAAAAHWAALLTAGIAGAISRVQAEQLAAAWLLAHPQVLDDGIGKREAVQAAAGWLASWLDEQDIDLSQPCQDVAPGILADGWLIGGTSAQAVTDQAGAEWGGWQPGDTVTAHGRALGLGLGAALGAAVGAAPQAAQEMAAGYVTRIARVLVDSTAAGLAAAAIGGAVLAAVTDPQYAHSTVLAQLVTAAGAAALAYYLARKVQYLYWLTAADSRVCAICIGNAAAGRVRAGQPFPSGDLSPPAHPGGCRCAAIPA